MSTHIRVLCDYCGAAAASRFSDCGEGWLKFKWVTESNIREVDLCPACIHNYEMFLPDDLRAVFSLETATETGD